MVKVEIILKTFKKPKRKEKEIKQAINRFFQLTQPQKKQILIVMEEMAIANLKIQLRKNRRVQ
jgi:hypothetical protein